MDRRLFAWFVERLPTYDPAWPADIRDAWMAAFIQLWRWACRLEVEDAIDAYTEARTEWQKS